MAHIAHDPEACPDGLTTLELNAVLPQNTRLKGRHLEIGGVDCVALAHRCGTALYVMDEAQMRASLRAYLEAFAARWPNFEVAYAGKAFLCKAMCQLVAEEGGWLDVSGGGELAIARAAGFDPAHIIVHGNNKTLDELRDAVGAPAGHIVADNFEELTRIEQLATFAERIQPVLLRIKPGIVADTHDYIRTGGEDSKFGFGLSDGWALRAFEQAFNAGHLDIRGLHFHIGSQIFDYDSYEAAVEVLFDFIAQLRESYGWLPRVLDLGGGVGVAYQATDKPAGIEAFVETLTAAVRKQCARLDIAEDKLKLIVEPGRSIVANAGVTLYTVGSIKELEGIRTYVAVDGGMTDNIRTALYGAHYECAIADRADAPRDALVTVAGKHCESGDVVAIDASVQQPRVGDVLAVFTTGAYNQSMASNYNKQPRPAVVWLRDGEVREVIRRETYDDLMRCEVGE
jgi:diaminopimelate decarboxylase